MHLSFSAPAGALLAGAVLFTTVGCHDHDDDGALLGFGPGAEAAGLTVFSDALTETGLDETLESGGPYSVFAPTDDAFAALPAGTLENLTDQELTDLLSYHVVDAEVTLADFAAGNAFTSLTGETLILGQINDQLYVNDAALQGGAISATNGALWQLDRVLTHPTSMLQTLQDRGNTRLVGLLNTAGIVSEIEGTGPLTVLAPSDAAFDALPAGLLETLEDPANIEDLRELLRIHVLGTGNGISQDLALGDTRSAGATPAETHVLIFDADAAGARVNSRRLARPNVVTTNGIVHEMDEVLRVQVPVGTKPSQTGGQILTYFGMVFTGLDQTLNNLDEDYTLFMPTDQAVVDMDEAVLLHLIEPGNEQLLVDTLLNHASEEVLVANEVLAATSIPTLLDGSSLDVSAAGEVAGAAILAVNVPAKNGVIHVIDTVLVPDSSLPPAGLALGGDGDVRGPVLDPIQAFAEAVQGVVDNGQLAAAVERSAARRSGLTFGGGLSGAALGSFGPQGLGLAGLGLLDGGQRFASFDDLEGTGLRGADASFGLQGAALGLTEDADGVLAQLSVAPLGAVGRIALIARGELSPEGLVRTTADGAAGPDLFEVLGEGSERTTLALWFTGTEATETLQLGFEAAGIESALVVID